MNDRHNDIPLIHPLPPTTTTSLNTLILLTPSTTEYIDHESDWLQSVIVQLWEIDAKLHSMQTLFRSASVLVGLLGVGLYLFTWVNSNSSRENSDHTCS